MRRFAAFRDTLPVRLPLFVIALALIPLSGCETTSSPNRSNPAKQTAGLTAAERALVAKRAEAYQSSGVSEEEARSKAVAWVRERKFNEDMAKKTDQDTVSVQGRLW